MSSQPCFEDSRSNSTELVEWERKIEVLVTTRSFANLSKTAKKKVWATVIKQLSMKSDMNSSSNHMLADVITAS